MQVTLMRNTNTVTELLFFHSAGDDGNTAYDGPMTSQMAWHTSAIISHDVDLPVEKLKDEDRKMSPAARNLKKKSLHHITINLMAAFVDIITIPLLAPSVANVLQSHIHSKRTAM